jgi:transposase
MPKRIALRTLTTAEEAEIRQLAKSRKEPIRLVQRARVIEAMLEDPSLPASRAGEKVGFSGASMGIHWVRRFNEAGVVGLMDGERSGRSPSHSQETRSALLGLALQKPRSLGYPFESWTLERLQRAFKERQGIHLSDSTIGTWVEAEGFRLRKQESWFHEPQKHDPEFGEKGAICSDLSGDTLANSDDLPE